MIDRRQALEVLDGIFAADGYRVDVHAWPDEAGSPLSIQVRAEDGACADCLVPKAVLRAIVAKKLELPDGTPVDVAYPPDAPAYLG